MSCISYIYVCVGCSSEMCVACTNMCTGSGCKNAMCSECLTKCVGCDDKVKCVQCIQSCGVCNKKYCNECVSTKLQRSCAVCHLVLCVTCSTLCMNCKTHKCRGCCAKCEKCKVNVCDSCSFTECATCARKVHVCEFKRYVVGGTTTIVCNTCRSGGVL